MNGAGRKTSPTFGFGLLDANEFVNIAEQWPGQIPERIQCTYSTGGLVLLISNFGILNRVSANFPIFPAGTQHQGWYFRSSFIWSIDHISQNQLPTCFNGLEKIYMVEYCEFFKILDFWRRLKIRYEAPKRYY